MKHSIDYATACRFPKLKIGDVPVPRLILGHLPFVGESYQGPEKNREYATRFSDMRNSVKILRSSVEGYGLTVTAAGIMNGSDRLAGLFLQAIKETERITETEIALIPCVQIPLTIKQKPVDIYRRWITYYEIEKHTTKEELARKYMEDPILECRSNWRIDFQEALQKSKPYGSDDIEDLQIDMGKLDEGTSILRDFKVLFLELGSETDLLAMTGRIDLLASLVDHIREKFGHRVLLGTHHAGSTIPVLEGSGVKFDGYVTPINKLGIMMFPTTNMALEAVKRSRRAVIAIKPLAGGRIPPREALEYVYKGQGVNFCMIGVGSEGEAEEDFTIASEILGSQSPSTLEPQP